MTTSTGNGVNVYVLTALASGLKLYAKTGMKPNIAWTPTAMLAKASELTGQKFKRGQYMEAAKACKAKADEIAPAAVADGEITA